MSINVDVNTTITPYRSHQLIYCLFYFSFINFSASEHQQSVSQNQLNMQVAKSNKKSQHDAIFYHNEMQHPYQLPLHNEPHI